MKNLSVLISAFFGVCLISFQSARADLVTFENYTGPSTFAAAGATQTLTYNFPDVSAVFSGGVVLTNESSQTVDFSSVYATSDPSEGGGANLTNPLKVVFSAPIQNFQIQILNALAGSYTISDNAGHSMDFSLATTGGSLATEGFAATGTQVFIKYNTNPTAWDFAIDNVTFNQPLGGLPEPASLGLCAAAFGIVARRPLRVRL